MSKDKALSWQTLGNLERGGIGRAIDKALADLVSDCERRPALDKKRKVTIELTLTPVQDVMEDGKAKPPLIKTQAAVRVSTPGSVGNGEILQITHAVNEDGEAVSMPAFPYNDLFPAGSN